MDDENDVEILSDQDNEELAFLSISGDEKEFTSKFGELLKKYSTGVKDEQ